MTNKTELKDYAANAFPEEVITSKEDTLKVVGLSSDLENIAEENNPRSFKGRFPEFEAALNQNLDYVEPARIYFGNLKKIVDAYNS